MLKVNLTARCSSGDHKRHLLVIRRKRNDRRRYRLERRGPVARSTADHLVGLAPKSSVRSFKNHKSNSGRKAGIKGVSKRKKKPIKPMFNIIYSGTGHCY